jgi:hypothetical protein
MSTLHPDEQIAALRRAVFEAIETWNAAHPHPMRSHREHGAVHVTQLYTDAGGSVSYAITVECALSGTPHLTFHGTDLAAVAEQALLTLEHKIDVELRRRAARADHADVCLQHGIAV